MRQQRSYSIEAIILKRTDYGEADRILTLFTPTKGKMHAIAKGTRRPVSKKAGHLELLNRSQLQMALGCNPALQNCAQCASELRPEENGFRASLGGVLCPQCSRFWERRLSLNALKVLRFLQRSKWIEASHLRLDANLQAELEAVMHDLLRFPLKSDLKSWSFLDMLNV